jgi:hypothetical protein
MAQRRRKRRWWDQTAITYLRRSARRKIRARHIAKRLRRTEGAVRQKAFALGLSLETREINNSVWLGG